MSVPVFTDPNYHEHARKHPEGTSNCVICGRPVRLTERTKWVYTWYGAIAVNDEEIKELQLNEPSGDTGMFPVGDMCLARHPELQPYTFESK